MRRYLTHPRASGRAADVAKATAHSRSLPAAGTKCVFHRESAVLFNIATANSADIDGTEDRSMRCQLVPKNPGI